MHQRLERGRVRDIARGGDRHLDRIHHAIDRSNAKNPLQTFLCTIGRGDGSGGAVVSSRDVRIRGEHVALLGVTGDVAYLARKAGVVAHDLVTGTERLVVPLTLGVSSGDQAGSTAVLLAEGTLVVVDLAAGRETNRFALPGYRGSLRLSPDARSLAVVSLQGSDETVEVRDVATGAVTATRPLRRDVRTFSSRATGLAWTDLTTVRAAWPELPRDADRIYPFADVLRTAEIRRS
jgi:hypothetical protein